MRLDAFLRGDERVRAVVGRRANIIAISPHAREALEAELLPQLEESVSHRDMVDGMWRSAEAAIRQAFLAKDQTYTRLVSHKTIDHSDEQYRDDLLAALAVWKADLERILSSDHEQPRQQLEVPPPMRAGPLADDFALSGWLVRAGDEEP